MRISGHGPPGGAADHIAAGGATGKPRWADHGGQTTVGKPRLGKSPWANHGRQTMGANHGGKPTMAKPQRAETIGLPTWRRLARMLRVLVPWLKLPPVLLPPLLLLPVLLSACDPLTEGIAAASVGSVTVLGLYANRCRLFPGHRQGLLGGTAGAGQDLLPPNRAAARYTAILHPQPRRGGLLAGSGVSLRPGAASCGRAAGADPDAGEGPDAQLAKLVGPRLPGSGRQVPGRVRSPAGAAGHEQPARRASYRCGARVGQHHASVCAPIMIEGALLKRP